MFTGIVEEIGIVKSFNNRKLVIECSKVLGNTQLGDSIAIDGCCQTVVEMTSNTFTADVSAETLSITTFGEFKAGKTVNLERALTPSTRLGGHIVQGHVDGKAEYLGEMTFRISEELDRYVVYKGSITVNGVSLTVAKCENGTFSVAIIPHTLENTNLKYLKVGDFVNIETDILGRYVEKFLSLNNNVGKSNINTDFLKENGFL